MNRFRTLFEAETPIILDGGWATELQKRGLALGESPDAWNLSRPDDVLAVARSYIEAGARAILTNTFQASPTALARLGLSAEARRINREGARLSRLAAEGTSVRVLGSIGPSGARGDGAAAAFALQSEALAEGGADALVLETFLGIEEARLAVNTARTVGLPVVASFFFNTSTGDPTTPDGSRPEEVARAMADAGADAVGANCGAGIAEFIALARRLHAACDLPVWIKPNAGHPAVEDGRAVYAMSPEAFAAHLGPLVEAGATFVGGCCGTTPEFIKALRDEASGLDHDQRASGRDLSQR
ncbi:homocysteine S-methyltransferase family protein [Paludisphaera soli]|uniref:homocysteine S-methyltransferase family protein n=1 Tax=Paludisphaera soli TaxID=2712865 RepID=UPI0013ED8F82|nr:homocysteine S-methyltransferase family protein [Paludisphaera soli]